MIGLNSSFKLEVCEYGWLFDPYKLKLACLVWNCSWICWLVVLWHGIWMF